jgi:hypothetical protein
VRLLIDTYALLWWLSDDPSLSAVANLNLALQYRKQGQPDKAQEYYRTPRSEAGVDCHAFTEEIQAG